MRVADLIAEAITKAGVTDVFCLVGGGAMFLNDAFGHHPGLKVTYMQHEQACSMAAEGYVRASERMAVVSVTTGPGGTNAITGVLGAFQDNYPMVVISGQVRYPTCVDSTGLPLRFLGEQEHNIVDTVKPLTKYAVMVKKPEDALYEVEKAIYIANEGRRGPTWVDVPMDIQSAQAEPSAMRHFVPEEKRRDWDRDGFIAALKNAKRPVILTGSAIRSADCTHQFRRLAEKLGLPVLAATYNGDLFPNDHPNYYGGFGIIGGRAGNLMMQNADLIVGMGCRMAFRQIGFNYDQFSPNSRRVVIDADPAELQKPTLRIDLPICADLRDVIDDLLNGDWDIDLAGKAAWLAYCDDLRARFPMYQQKFENEVPGQVNPYCFAQHLKGHLKDNSVIMLGNSTIAAHVLQLGIEKPAQRIVNNMNCGSMGYDLPAAVGTAIAIKDDVILVTGDGSIMLNLQELMTIRHYNIPVKIFIGCNGGYRGVVRSQTNMFKHFTGCTPETGVGMPDFERIAGAFDIPFVKIREQRELDEKFEEVLAMSGPVICVWPQDPDQLIEPRVMNRRSASGSIESTPIDDLSPFLSREEYQAIQYENWVKTHG